MFVGDLAADHPTHESVSPQVRGHVRPVQDDVQDVGHPGAAPGTHEGDDGRQVKDAMGDSDDVDPQVKEQMENVMKDFGGDAEGLDEMMKQAMFAELDSDDEPEGMDEMFAQMMGGGGAGGGGSEEDMIESMMGMMGAAMVAAVVEAIRRQQC